MATNQTTASVANDIRDIKPPLEISNGWAWLWWTFGMLVFLAVLILLWRYVHRRMTHIPVTPPVPAHIRAKQMLERALSLIVEPKQFCTLVSDTIRTYLEECFNFRAPERTTEEFLRELQTTNLLTVEQKESLGKFLASCDLVKFAKYEPRETELRELHGSALRLVEETEPAEKAESGKRQPSTNDGSTGESGNEADHAPASAPLRRGESRITHHETK